jgi:hypothetical protein
MGIALAHERRGWRPANYIGNIKFNGVTFAIGEGTDGDARGRACSQNATGQILDLKFFTLFVENRDVLFFLLPDLPTHEVIE